MLDRLERPAVDVARTAPSDSLAGRQALFFALVAAVMLLIITPRIPSGRPEGHAGS